MERPGPLRMLTLLVSPVVGVALVIVVLLGSGPALAQTCPPNTIFNRDTGECVPFDIPDEQEPGEVPPDTPVGPAPAAPPPPPPPPTGPRPTAGVFSSCSPGRASPGANDLVATRSAIFSEITQAVGNLPISSAGGFTFQFDPSLGGFTRTSDSFGPLFADRVETAGRGKLVLHASYSRFTFDDIDGVSLGSGELGSFLTGDGCPAGQIRRGQYYRIREDVTTDLLSLNALYGVTDRLDVSLTIPLLRVKVKERVQTQPGPARPDLAPVDVRLSGEDTGIGDLVLRGKYRIVSWPELWGGRLGIAGILDVKVPTGSEGDRQKNKGLTTTNTETLEGLDLGDPPLGTGIIRVRPQLIVSGTWFNLSPHVNVGAELGTTEGVTNDLVYAVGADYSILRRITVIADFVGRYALSATRERLILGTGEAKAERYAFSFGVKANPIGTLIIFANVLVPIGDGGLTDDFTPTFGVEWTF